jgi:hypothetical protein
MGGESHAGEPVLASSARDELPPLAEHSCLFLVPLRMAQRRRLAEADLTLQDRLVDAAQAGVDGTRATGAKPRTATWLPADERAPLLRNDRRTRIWDPAPMNVGPDLYPHVRRLLGDAASSSDAAALCFRLADLPRQLLRGKSIDYDGERATDPQHDGDGRRVLELKLSAAAKARIAARQDAPAPDALQVDIEQMRLIAFRTGFGIVLIEVTLRNRDRSPLHPYCLVEGVISLARFNQLRWSAPLPAAGAKSAAVTSFTLGDIVTSLHASTDIGGTGRRLFSATYAQFASSPAPGARRHFAIALARHYSDDYRVADAIEGVRFVADFENVVHAVAMEGCATIVDATPASPGASDFVRNFKSGTFDRTYVPVMVLALHEFIALLYYANDAKFWVARDNDNFSRWVAQTQKLPAADAAAESQRAVDTDAAFATLARLRDEVIRFRLCYRFSHVSYVSMHNAVYAAMRDAWNLRQMLADLGQDTAEITTLLEERFGKQNASRVRTFGLVGAAGLAYISAHAFFENLPETGIWDYISSKLPDVQAIPTWIPWSSPEFIKQSVALVFSVVVAGFVWWVTSVKTSHPEAAEDASELEDDAIEDIVVHSLPRE